MEAEARPIGLPSGVDSPTEAADDPRGCGARDAGRLAWGEGIKRIVRELGVDRKTVKAWRRRADGARGRRGAAAGPSKRSRPQR
jgi:hypothetical protein